jgi:hypothetical protein
MDLLNTCPTDYADMQHTVQINSSSEVYILKYKFMIKYISDARIF